MTEICPDATPDAIKLLNKFLVYPSLKRISAKEALLDRYFYTWPLPAHFLALPKPVSEEDKKYSI